MFSTQLLELWVYDVGPRGSLVVNLDEEGISSDSIRIMHERGDRFSINAINDI